MADYSILSENRCALGEGPFYCERRDTLFWFDILGKKRHEHNFKTGEASSIDLPEMASAMAVIDDKADLIFTETGLWKREITTGAFSPVCAIEDTNPATRSNDARVHSSGAFWLGTMGKNAEDKAGAIYHFKNGVLTKLFPGISIPNAICFSPDGTVAYFTDTRAAKLMRVKTDPRTGLPAGEPEILIDHKGKDGGLDGAVVDRSGTLWVALWGAAAVHNYSAYGALIAAHGLGAKQASCPAFVGGGKIAVTTAWQGMDEAAKAADPNAGKTFLLDVGAAEKFEPKVAL